MCLIMTRPRNNYRTDYLTLPSLNRFFRATCVTNHVFKVFNRCTFFFYYIFLFLSSWITLQIIFRKRLNVKGLNIVFKNSNRCGLLIVYVISDFRHERHWQVTGPKADHAVPWGAHFPLARPRSVAKELPRRRLVSSVRHLHFHYKLAWILNY